MTIITILPPRLYISDNGNLNSGIAQDARYTMFVHMNNDIFIETIFAGTNWDIASEIY